MLSIVPKRSLMSAVMVSAVLVAAAFADGTPPQYAAEPSETLHLASEGDDARAMKEAADAFLSTAKVLQAS